MVITKSNGTYFKSKHAASIRLARLKNNGKATDCYVVTDGVGWFISNEESDLERDREVRYLFQKYPLLF